MVAALPEPKQLVFIEARDHFFEGGLQELEEAVASLPLPRGHGPEAS